MELKRSSFCSGRLSSLTHTAGSPSAAVNLAVRSFRYWSGNPQQASIRAGVVRFPEAKGLDSGPFSPSAAAVRTTLHFVPEGVTRRRTWKRGNEAAKRNKGLNLHEEDRERQTTVGHPSSLI